MALSQAVKKLFEQEYEWEEEGVHDNPPTLYDIWAAFHSFSDEETVEAAGGLATFDEIYNEVANLRKKHGDKKSLKDIEKEESA